MTTSHNKHEHHDHSEMEHDQHSSATSAEEDIHADHTSPMAAAESQHDMHAGHAAHGMNKPGEHTQHVDHSGHEDLFRKRFWVSLLLSIPVLLYTPMLQMWFGFSMPDFPGSVWVAPLFSVIIFLYGGVPFIQMAVPEVRNRQPGM